MYRELWRTFYCLKIIIEASKNIQPNTCPSASLLLPGAECRALPSHSATHSTSQDPALGGLLAHRELSHCLGRGPGGWWGWLALYTLQDPPSTEAVCELCVEKGVSSLGRGPPRGKDKEPVPTLPTLPQSASSREAVIIIFRHLLSKLQVLLLSLAPLLRRDGVRAGC